MAFNVEPAVDLEGYRGVRHCGIVTMIVPYRAGHSRTLTSYEVEIPNIHQMMVLKWMVRDLHGIAAFSDGRHYTNKVFSGGGGT